MKLFQARLRILAAYRLNGHCFSPGGESVLLMEFAEWALRKFTEPEIPNELAVLGRLGKGPLPEPGALAKMVATWRSSPTRTTTSEMVSIGAASAKSNEEKNSPSIVGVPGIQRQRASIEDQKAIILLAITSLNFDPMRFPTAKGLNGAKKAVLNACKSHLTKSQFLHRWQTLRDDRKIIDNVGKIAN